MYLMHIYIINMVILDKNILKCVYNIWNLYIKRDMHTYNLVCIRMFLNCVFTKKSKKKYEKQERGVRSTINIYNTICEVFSFS